jgi:hypothetical protein
MFQRTAAGAVEQQNLIRYQPPDNAAPAKRIGSIVANAKTDALGIPQFSDRDREVLLATFAPVFELETTGEFDRFGPLQWRAGETPEVNVSRPTVYRRVAFTRYSGRTLVQLVYMIWFPERPQSSSLDPVSGKLDGIVFRVTLDQSGSPLVYIFAAATTCSSRRHGSDPYRRRIRRSNGLSYHVRCPRSKRRSALSFVLRPEITI